MGLRFLLFVIVLLSAACTKPQPSYKIGQVVKLTRFYDGCVARILGYRDWGNDPTYFVETVCPHHKKYESDLNHISPEDISGVRK